jgi:phage terminase small subunit
MKPPAYLRKETKLWFQGVLDDFILEPHHIRLLTVAAEAWDRTQQAREILRKRGLTYQDRFGAPRARPEAAIQRDMMVVFMRALRELDLDIEPPAETPRPPGLHSNRGRSRNAR